MSFNFEGIPGCYYIKMAFHGKNKNDTGYEFQIWGSYPPIVVSARECILGKHGTKIKLDSIEDAIQFCKEFMTGEKEMVNERFLLYDSTGKILNDFNDLESLQKEARDLLLANKYTVLFVGKYYGMIRLDVVFQDKEQHLRTIDGKIS